MSMKKERNPIEMYMAEIQKRPLLSREDEQKYMALAATGDAAAKKKLIDSNLRFVVQVASKYQDMGLSMEDLISSGNEGLVLAADHVKADKNVKFITYAVWWIRQSIIKALYDTGRCVRIPAHRSDMLYSDDYKGVSMDAKVGSDDCESTLGDLMADTKSCNPEDEYMRNWEVEDLYNRIAELKPSEQFVITARYGLDGEDPKTLREIGDEMGFSKEAARKLEAKVIDKLRKSA